MPTVKIVGPYRVFFVSLDYAEPPHVHVRRENMTAKYWLDPVSLARAGGFGRTELGRIARMVEQHRDELLEAWNDFFGQ